MAGSFCSLSVSVQFHMHALSVCSLWKCARSHKHKKRRERLEHRKDLLLTSATTEEDK